MMPLIVVVLIAIGGWFLPNPTRELIWITSAVAGIVLIIPPKFRTPLRHASTYYHEMGHAIAAVLTGGKVRSIHVEAQGGHATTVGGWRVVVLLAGYLLPMTMGGIIASMAVAFATPKALMIGLAVLHGISIPFSRGWRTIVLAVGLTAICGIFATEYVPPTVGKGFGICLGVGLIIEGIINIGDLFYLSIKQPGQLGSDADKLAKLIWILPHPVLWSIVIGLMGIAIVGGVVWVFAMYHGNIPAEHVGMHDVLNVPVLV